ncbi:hypothetical protein ORJ00_15930 [Rheinheimera baltica]|uniref:hypothetical protein n=1 Tax=Rheinheimera baltica TaxID=67576 RepID=UPI00273F1A6D|nr:hypothetical protein [Rheinheimera baltica]MDP5144237.1 hypothetical protein [Rheinheimera baltica]
MTKQDDSSIAKNLMLLFNASLGILAMSILFVLIDWYFFDEQHREFIKPIGILGLVGFGVAMFATLLLREKL